MIQTSWRQQLRSHRVRRADSEFQRRAFLALTEMSPSTEVTDLLLPLASTPSPNLSPQAALLSSAGCNHLPHPGKGWGTARQLSPAPQQPKSLSPTWLCCQGPPSPGPEVSPALLAAVEQTSSQQQAGSFLHLCPASQSCGSRAMGCKTQQRIRGDCSSAGPWQRSLQDLPARASALFLQQLS